MYNNPKHSNKAAMHNSAKHYHHLNQADRDRIQSLLDDNVEQAEIARIIGRDKGTISREIAQGKRKRGTHTVKNIQRYEATLADHTAYLRRHNAKYQGYKIEQDKTIRAYVIKGLRRHWGPDEIAGSMKQKQLPYYASKNAIYGWIYSSWGQAYAQCLYTKRYKPKKRKPKAKKILIPDRTGIEQRPVIVSTRTTYGHHEADTIVSSKRSGGKAALAVDIERKSRLLYCRKIANLRPQVFTGALRNMHQRYTKVATETFDNGIENRDYQRLGVPSYFCDPYSSYQKGSVENGNRLMRRYFPKGTNFDTVSPQKIAHAVQLINEKPRKILGYKSALQVAEDERLLKDKTLSKQD
jgi:IS30 family transposase